MVRPVASSVALEAVPVRVPFTVNVCPDGTVIPPLAVISPVAVKVLDAVRAPDAVSVPDVDRLPVNEPVVPDTVVPDIDPP